MANIIDNATNITARINVMEPVPNVDINYGPYTSVANAVQSLLAVEAVCQGLTVGIQSNSDAPIVEYWFKEPVTNTMTPSELIEKLVLKLSDATTITYGTNDTPVTSMNLTNDKLTFTVNGTSYSFRLTEWHDIADFYVLFAKISYHNGNYYAEIDGNDVIYNTLSTEQLLSLAVTENGGLDEYGYTIKTEQQKETLVLHDGTNLKCDYIIRANNIPSNKNTILIMYRVSGNTTPSLSKLVYTNNMANQYLYNTQASIDELGNYLELSNKRTDNGVYNVVGYEFIGSESIDSDFGITFNLE